MCRVQMNQRHKMSDLDNPLSCGNPMRNTVLHHDRGSIDAETEPQRRMPQQIKTILVNISQRGCNMRQVPGIKGFRAINSFFFFLISSCYAETVFSMRVEF